MQRRDIQELIDREPFEPFRIKLVNGDRHDIFFPQNVVVTRTDVTHVQTDQNWVVFPIDKIASLESLIADYTGQVPK